MAPDHDDAFAQIVQRAPVARIGQFADMADNLPAGAEHPLHFQREELGIVVDPAGQAEIGVGVGPALFDLSKGVLQITHGRPNPASLLNECITTLP